MKIDQNRKKDTKQERKREIEWVRETERNGVKEKEIDEREGDEGNMDGQLPKRNDFLEMCSLDKRAALWESLMLWLCLHVVEDWTENEQKKNGWQKINKRRKKKKERKKRRKRNSRSIKRQKEKRYFADERTFFDFSSLSYAVNYAFMVDTHFLFFTPILLGIATNFTFVGTISADLAKWKRTNVETFAHAQRKEFFNTCL